MLKQELSFLSVSLCSLQDKLNDWRDLWKGVGNLKNENQYLPVVHQRVQKNAKWMVKTSREKAEASKSKPRYVSLAEVDSAVIANANKPFRWKWGHSIQTKAKCKLCIVTMAIRSETERQDRETCEIRPQRISLGPSYRLKNVVIFLIQKLEAV